MFITDIKINKNDSFKYNNMSVRWNLNDSITM